MKNEKTVERPQSQKEIIQQFVGKRLDKYFSFAAPAVCGATVNLGIDIYFPPRNASRNGIKRRVTLHGPTANAFAGLATQVGSLSIKTLDENDHFARIECNSFEIVPQDQPHWWSICIIECNDAQRASMAVDILNSLPKNPVGAIILQDALAYINDPKSKAALQALKDFSYPSKALEIPGITRTTPPRYDFKKTVLIYEPSGGATTPGTIWANQRSDVKEPVNNPATGFVEDVNSIS